MPRLILQFENHVLKDCVLDRMATIGRLADNIVVVDSAAVSGHHACVFREGDYYVVEDLASTNGTFVNEKRITRHRLEDGDVVRIGKHTLHFDASPATAEAGGEQQEAARITSNPSDTVFLDGDKYRSLMAVIKETEQRIESATAQAMAPVGVLRVLSGRTDQTEYKLDSRTSLVGASERALVRLHGWFKPKEAVAIARNDEGYVATALGGTTLVNKQRLDGRKALKDRDVLEVSGVTLEFRMVS